MSPDEQIATVENLMKTVNKGDLQGALQYVHPDFVIHEQPGLPYEGEWRGHDGFVSLMTYIGSIWKGWRDTPFPYELASVGSRVMKETRSSATARSTGERIEMDMMEVLEFKDDLIHTIRPYYWDPEWVRRATAGSPPPPSRGSAG
ncbi:nuclear transport factor 2 family protein [Aeromicrobium fastidiosum]|uniref:Nuclear transport factor 2 family protein n=1 Tax=Aeromicrobium fastidiosum TaxID=52699 RepID=A0A641AP78_9ACTN|nr:nuclear transport factor 2 family protein [Aeromicrobium fastidiosum]KAA1379896.1 nuclear transport factor 2 family protein [Aeromicrobium fastidiosum]MBP2389402.1 ketosteroid isomerase-like protein [Aeromicrobium fastidiosum]